VLVTRSGKEAIENHFDCHYELERQLEMKGKAELLNAVRGALPRDVEVLSVRQPRAAGLGDAIRCARPAIGKEPFAVLLPDVLPGTPRLAANNLRCLLQAFSGDGAAQILVEPVAAHEVDQYGIVDCGGETLEPGETADIRALVEKPEPKAAPSCLAVVGRYVLPNGVLELLEGQTAGAGGEIQLTDALHTLCRESSMQALMMHGESFDCGNKLGYAKACLAFSLQDGTIADSLSEFAYALLARSNTCRGHRLAVMRQVA
jgi:UTP--glucose-1-phosphate uridylyltransferase